MATKTARYFTVIAIIITLSLFPPFSAMGREETITSSDTTIVTNQDVSSGNGRSSSSSSSSSIIDKTQDLTQSGIGSMAEDIEERVDKLISSTTNITPVQLSGKIASSRINLNNGNVEQVLFGDWSANVRSIDDASFVADFSARSSNSSSNNEEDAHYRIGNLKLTSLQRQNENIALGGTVDVREEKGARTWEESPVTILLINDRAIVIRFEQQELNEVFSSQPIIGVVAA